MFTKEKTNPVKIARIAGFLYLLLVPLGIFGIMYVPNIVIVSGNISETVSNIVANESLFRLSIVSALLVQLVNLAVVLLLYKLLNPVNKNVARLMVAFIALAVPIAMLNELNNGAVLLLANSPEQPNNLIALFLDLHEYGVQIAGIFWGLWLFPMGYLVFKSNYIPKIIGIFLMIGCFGYLVDSFIFILSPDFGVAFSEFLFIGEVLLPLWLLIKGVNVERWQERELALEIA
ncbi:MAG: DUF4386 domain-containing protein [Chloroflexi bacterium]|nr:DUF4386 domain-containing protein [Chloroflexota bacterium]